MHLIMYVDLCEWPSLFVFSHIFACLDVHMVVGVSPCMLFSLAYGHMFACVAVELCL